jgi:hypothetical protein
MLAPQSQPLSASQILRARFPIHHKQRIHPDHHLHRFRIVRIHFHGVHKLPPRMYLILWTR